MTDLCHVSDEQALARFVRHADRAALGELARRFELPLLGLCCGMLGGRSDLAMDAVQETWVRVIRFGSSFKGGSGVKTWLYRIAINQCRNVQARSMRTATREGSTHSSGVEPMALADAASAAEIAERDRDLHAALEMLASPRRAIVLLCYHAGMTHEQAAEILEIPLGTLKSRLNAALTELRARLSAERYQHERC